MMLKKIVAILAFVFAAPVMAQSAESTTTATGTAQAANNVTVVADAGRYAPADTSVKYSGHTWTTPNVGGSYFAGANPCLVGTGAGAAGGPVGFSINIGKSDKGCTRRSDAAAWNALGFPSVAIARMCSDVASADAWFAATGQTCPGADRNRYKLADGSLAPVSIITNGPNNRAIIVDQPGEAPVERAGNTPPTANK